MSSDRKDSEQDLSQYVSAVKEIKNAILDSRYRVARQANKEVLQLNYGIGRFISVNSRSAKWGSNAISVISKMLQQELPGLKGFSEASIKMMRIFYEEWCLIFEKRLPKLVRQPTFLFDLPILPKTVGNILISE